MANRDLFKGTAGVTPRAATTTNEAGGVAFSQSVEHVLAQYAATGCFSGTYYATARGQLNKLFEVANACSSEFLAKTAVYVREQSFMKDMPAALCAILHARGAVDLESRQLLQTVFPRVIDNGKMMRNFVQIVRSGVTGRKSFGTAGKRMIGRWLNSRSPEYVFKITGQSPSVRTLVQLGHPKPTTPAQDAVYSYLVNGTVPVEKASNLPDLVSGYLEFCKDPTITERAVPNVPFEMLTHVPLTTEQWKSMALNGGYLFTIKNLNTFQRHGVLKDSAAVKLLAEKIGDVEQIRRSRVFPYQLYMAYLASSADANMPTMLTNALQDALDASLDNVPAVEGNVWIFPDVSASMGSPVTGYRKSATTAVTCVQVAALMAVALVRKNPNARVLPIDTKLHSFKFNPRDSVVTNATLLSKFGGGGTALGLAMDMLNKDQHKADFVYFISDNESWMDRRSYYSFSGQTETTGIEAGFAKLRGRNPNCKLVLHDIQPYGTTQAPDVTGRVLNVGGFSDRVFDVIGAFAQGASDSHWVDVINSIKLVPPTTSSEDPQR